MSVSELHTRILAAKKFLNVEMVRHRTNGTGILSFREIGEKLDLIHQVERVGIRNLGERDMRHISRLLTQVEELQVSSN